MKNKGMIILFLIGLSTLTVFMCNQYVFSATYQHSDASVAVKPLSEPAHHHDQADQPPTENSVRQKPAQSANDNSETADEEDLAPMVVVAEDQLPDTGLNPQKWVTILGGALLGVTGWLGYTIWQDKYLDEN